MPGALPAVAYATAVLLQLLLGAAAAQPSQQAEVQAALAAADSIGLAVPVNGSAELHDALQGEEDVVVLLPGRQRRPVQALSSYSLPLNLKLPLD